MIISEFTLSHWLTNGPFAYLLDEVISSGAVAAPDVISMLARAGIAGEQRRIVVEDLCALGLRIEPTTIDQLLPSVELADVMGTQNLPDMDPNPVYAWALAQHQREDLAVMSSDGPVVVSISRGDLSVQKLESETAVVPLSGA